MNLNVFENLLKENSSIRTTQITRIALQDFRNYTLISVPIHHKRVVFWGDNGAGKTNLLEALSFLSPGRGLRRVRYSDVLSQKAMRKAWAISFTLQEQNIETKIKTSLEPHQASRKIYIDQLLSKKAEDLLNYTQIIWMTPSMDGLFIGPAADRCRFFDRFVMALHPDHGRRMNAYEKAMRSRNRLLTDAPDQEIMLEGLEQQMSELSVQITKARHQHLSFLQNSLALLEERDIPFPFPEIALSYKTPDIMESANKEDLQAVDFAALYKNNRYQDIMAGRTLKSIHRFDVDVTHKTKKIEAARASTGEQKALLICLILAQALLVCDKTHHAPIMLMDEIAAHLDKNRRKALFQLLDEVAGQYFLTGTDENLFEALSDETDFFKVENNTLSMIE